MDKEEYEVPLNSIYEFTIAADASWYGGRITGFSYGFDLPDVNDLETDPSGIGAWTPWSTTRTTIIAEFKEARDYFLYVKCKDDGGGQTLATIHFKVITLDPNKNLGVIDDWRMYPQYPDPPDSLGEPLDDAQRRLCCFGDRGGGGDRPTGKGQ